MNAHYKRRSQRVSPSTNVTHCRSHSRLQPNPNASAKGSYARIIARHSEHHASETPSPANQTDSSVQEEAESCMRLLTGAVMGLGGAEGRVARQHLVQCDCGTGVGVRAFSHPEPSKRPPGQQGSLMTRCKAHAFPVTEFRQPLSLVTG